MKRRTFLVRVAAGCLVTGFAAACEHVVTREEVLASLVREVALPDCRALEGASADLSQHIKSWASAPDDAAFSELRASWKQTLLAGKRAYAFRNGPLVESNALLRAMFWPVRGQAIDALIAGSGPLDAAMVDAAGVDLKGLFAMEHLLFDPTPRGEPADKRFVGAEGGRARALLQAYGDDVHAYARAAAEKLADGKAFERAFSAPGQENVERLVNQMVATVESVAAQKVGLVLELHANRRLAPAEIEGAPSGLSAVISATLVASTERLYLGVHSSLARGTARVDGPGLGALAKQVSAPVHERIVSRFKAARAALEALDAPLEQLVQTEHARVERAFQAAKQLEIALKVDLASCLGVTLTFLAGDGD